ncbi:Proteins of 100 residues with WXG [Actinopolyspora lacussalsi subsp. righensis]|uniref:Proteins of 100 residues with WXG n=1 Tax=Actinopolyspora righensis TaxID=995060 RepID=A0A1I6Z6Q8_9ACTN|nr:WXG100 family type VII secretion target [Actinopolyspora righensis]SFT58386.1 Proteins of 100 residues with WXG [Actinopolyspora righensis]
MGPAGVQGMAQEQGRENYSSAYESGKNNGSPAGQGNSDLHLDKLNELEKVMRDGVWGRVFRRWRAHEGAAKKYPGDEYAVYGTGATETHDLPKLRGIDWGMLESASGKLSELAGNREAWLNHLDSLEKGIDQAWQGSAADAARQRYTGVKGPLNKYCDDLNATGRALHEAAKVPKNRIGPGGLSDFKDKSSFYKHYGEDDQSEEMLQDLDGMEKMVREGFEASKYKLDRMGEFGKALLPRLKQLVDLSHSGAPGDNSEDERVMLKVTWDDLRLPGSPDCRDVTGTGETSCRDRIKWLDDFCGWYAHDVKALRKEIHDAYKHTEKAFSALRDQLAKLDDDTFDELGEQDPQQDSGQQDSGQQGGGQQGEQRTPSDAGVTSRSQGTGGTGGAPGGAPGGVPGGGGGPAGTTGGVGAPGGQRAGMPEQPETPSAEEIRSRLSEQGGEAASAAPNGTGGAGAEPDLDQVTIGEGAERIAVREADSQGRTQLTLLDEQGQPRNYQIPFGESGGATGSDSVAPAATESPRAPGQQGVPPTAGESTNVTGSSREPTVVRPNEDGTAVIRDGERTVNVARDAEGGLRVTVDDGNGQPSTQTVDFGQDRSAAPVDAATFPGTPAEEGQGPDGARQSDPYEAAARTTSQWAGAGVFGDSEQLSGRPTFTAFSGDLFSSPEDTGGSIWGGGRSENQLGDVAGEAGLSTMGGKSGPTDSQGATGLASMGESSGTSGQSEQGAARGGMMPMGGMGGAGQQGGGDEERSNDSPWRTEGDLFDDGLDSDTSWQYQAVLGEPNEK